MNLGWFKDVLDLELILDHENSTTRHTLLRDHKTPMFDSKGKLSGKLKITPSDGSPVWQWGIKLQLESSASYYDSFHSESVMVIEEEIYDEGYIDEETTLGFEIDLNKTKDGIPVLENYSGELYVLNHTLIITISRPWYTFDVMHHHLVAFETIEAAPTEEVAEHPLVQTILKLNADAPMKNELVLADYPGICSMKYEKSCYNIEERINGKLTLELMIPKEAVTQPKKHPELKLVFYKIELGDEEENEVIIREGVFQDLSEKITQALSEFSESSKQPTKQKEPSAENDAVLEPVTDKDPASWNQQREPEPPQSVFINENFDFLLTEFPQSHLEAGKEEFSDTMSPNFLTPTFYVEDFGSSPLSVRYFIRLVITDGEREYWNTNEIILFRDHFEGKHERTMDSV